MTYNLRQIAIELLETAQGVAYYGNALRVAKDLPFILNSERSTLDKWATGAQTSGDRFKLQDIANKVYMYSK